MTREMTRETVIPTVLVRRMKKSSVKKNTRTEGTRRAVAVNAKSPAKKGSVSPVRRVRNEKSAAKVTKAILSFAMWLLRLFVGIILAIAEFFNNAWEVFQEKCGEETVRMGTEGLFGEAKDGYYHTSEGFRLDASKVTVIESGKGVRK